METLIKVFTELKNRGETFVRIDDDMETIVTVHGNLSSYNTINYWILDKDNNLVCIDTKSVN